MARFSCPTVEKVIRVMRAKDYVVFDDPRGYDLNLVGIRTSARTGDEFDDWITVFYYQDGCWRFFAFPGTTDPGTYWRLNPERVEGVAILKPGQYRSAYRIGKHKKYKALRQQSAMTVFRDDDRDAVLDDRGVVADTGVFGINLHRAHEDHLMTRVNKWSAGCQVVQDVDHFIFLLVLCEKAKAIYGNSFTYTLLQEPDFD